MKKIGLICLALLVSLSLVGCTETTPPTSEEASYTAGEYEVTVMGHNDDMVVKTVFTETQISEVVVVSHQESAGIADPALNTIPTAIVEKQSLAVDVVTGATVTSAALLKAVEEAVVLAGGNVENLKVEEEVARTAVTKDTDVVVIGSGIAGLTAALEAQENGANVILVEKMGKTGGTTALSGGMILATNSFLQTEVEDTPEALADYWFERSEEAANYDMLLFAAQESANTIQWLADNGVEFSETVVPSGIAPELRGITTTTRGPGFIDPLVEKFTENSGELLLNTEATEILVDENQVVIGIKAVGKTEDITINADAVVLATGGYDANPEMLAEYAPRAAEDHIIYSSAGNTGDGITMATAIGADTVFTGSLIGFKGLDSTVPYYTPVGLLGLTRGLIVDQAGDRFFNESLDYSLVYDIWDKHGGSEYYAIFDSTNENPALEEAVERGYAQKADTIEELATLVGANNLNDTVSRYNELAQSGVDSDFEKANAFLAELTTAPYYAVTIKNATLGTFGGVKIDMESQVLNTEGTPIAGLYASGEVSNGEWFNQFYPASGTSISISATYGLVAGENAATYALAK